ncbi:hypothetical protein [Streptomyces sp. A1-5]|uniref:hypothetical protein n=1 Tax=Streptomyces sp. A1-5 TaxID=2738410 RepID=UPI001F45381D|nr:hypothetical protein [Streptomyces sp. A1-5]UJB45955.1 hypothetical protein HRD51_38965 [Streptomyces sp. A1-5]
MRLVTANASALALARASHAAGSGSAVLGTVQSALSAVVAPPVGLGGASTATPMFLSMALCSALAFLCYGLTRGAGGGASVTTAAGGHRDPPVGPAPVGWAGAVARGDDRTRACTEESGEA